MKNKQIKKAVNIPVMIDAIEAEILSYPQVDLPPNHLFTPGIYLREIFIPKGITLSGKLHKTEHPYVVLKGKVSIFTESDGMLLLEGPKVDVTKIGTRRVIYAHEDSLFMTIHANPDNCRDLEELERRLIEPHVNSLLISNVKEIKQ